MLNVLKYAERNLCSVGNGITRLETGRMILKGKSFSGKKKKKGLK